ncbi:MAG: ABC transporter permease, partial [Candidatus Acidiferrales bacterium]
MNWLRQIGFRVRGVLGKRHSDRALDEELQTHLVLLIEQNMERGMSPEAARREAKLSLGGADQIKESVRDHRGLPLLETFVQDLRFASRMLRKSPGFTAVAVLTLALGIGANTAIFSAVNAILFESLPYPHPNRIMAIWEVSKDGSHADTTFGMYRGLAERNRSFDALSLLATWQPTLTGTGKPERIDAQRVSWTYFRVLGVSPILGTDFQASEDRLHGPNVVILSDGLWHRRFGGDPTIIGSQITLDESSGSADTDRYTVIGVMPRSFENVLRPTAEAWAPLQIDISQGRAWGHWLRMIGRLRRGVGVAQATQELTALAHQVLQEQHPDSYGTN